MMRSLTISFFGLLATGLWVAPTQTHAFGTVNILGQQAEHERITRRAFQCGGDTANQPCIDPLTLDKLAGRDGTFGAVGYPDKPGNGLIFDSEAHCDNGDHQADTPDHDYPRSQADAQAYLIGCRDFMRDHLRQAVEAAALMVDEGGQFRSDAISLDDNCIRKRDDRATAKCRALKHFGIALHASQDFYSHTNWTDAPVDNVDRKNPQGLDRSGATPWLNDGLFVPSEMPLPMPDGLISGCFQTVFEFGCKGRVKHKVINKDFGTIPLEGSDADVTYGPAKTPRGEVADNFADAVAAAIDDSRIKLEAFEEELMRRHPEYGETIVCALLHDDPMSDCIPPNDQDI